MTQVTIETALAGVRSLITQELMAKGHSASEIARVLNITPSAVTQYSTGKRGKRLNIGAERREATVTVELAAQISERLRKGENADEFPLILDAAYSVMRSVSSLELRPRKQRGHLNKVATILRTRIEQEQRAAQRNTTIAVTMKDDIARMIFRQIATDSIRHADIVATVMNYLERDFPKQPRKEDILQIESILREEESTTEQPLSMKGLEPSVRLLLSSVDMDEEKHRRLLRGLIQVDRKATQTRRHVSGRR